MKNRTIRLLLTIALVAVVVLALSGRLWPMEQQAAPGQPTVDLPLILEGEDQPAATAQPPQTTEDGGGQPQDVSQAAETPAPIPAEGSYTSRDDVALYLHTYGHLPENFITKEQARKLGWSGGGLDGYADGKCIGGDRFGNYEGLLPEKRGRTYYECDVGTLHKSSRGAKRIIFSSDGLIYYTGDHYESFTLLYGEE